VNDDRDQGSIIDFTQRRKRLNLGEVRKELRPWLNGAYFPAHSQRKPPPSPTPASKDRHKILAQFESFQVIANHPYLNRLLLILKTMSHSRFEGTIYNDRRGNVIFPHRDSAGVCGYELRNREFKGFSRGGTRGLWISNRFQDDQRLVICESPIDCLSYYQLFPNAQTRYFATGGSLSEKQKDLLRTAMERLHSKGGEIIVAMDRDEAGERMAQELKRVASEVTLYRHIPQEQKDWNEALQAHIVWEREHQPSPDPGFSL
jgi:5S rRNA maturation endonuclease (ribonuclease M5)